MTEGLTGLASEEVVRRRLRLPEFVWGWIVCSQLAGVVLVPHLVQIQREEGEKGQADHDMFIAQIRTAVCQAVALAAFVSAIRWFTRKQRTQPELEEEGEESVIHL